MSVRRCACVFTLFLGCCLFRCNLFFCLNVQLTNGRLYFNASLGWSFCPRYWAGATEWLEHVVLLLYATCCCFFLSQTMNFTFKISSISFGCTKCRCVTCVRLYICGANLHSWCMFLFFLTLVLPFCDYNFFSFFFGLVTKVAVVFLWVLVPLETVFPAKNSNNTCCTRPFRGSEHN